MSPLHCHFQVRDSWNNVAWPYLSHLVKSEISPNMIYALNKQYVVLSSLFLIQVFTFRCTLHMQEFRSDWYGSFEKFQTMKDDYMCLLYMKNFNGSKNLFGLRRPLCQWGGELARRWQEGVGGAGGEGVNSSVNPKSWWTRSAPSRTFRSRSWTTTMTTTATKTTTLTAKIMETARDRDAKSAKTGIKI